MKGLELPINVLVIVAIAIVVLLAVIALYFGGFTPFSSAVNIEGVKNEGCRQLVQQKNCNAATNAIAISNFDADQDTFIGTADTGSGWTWGTSVCKGAVGSGGDNLASLCKCWYTRDSDASCRQLCGCP
jgi:hypothetical protein